MHASSVLSLVLAVGLLASTHQAAAQPAVSSSAPSVRAARAAILVYGKAGPRELRAVQTALEDAAKAAGWAPDSSTSSGDRTTMIRCLSEPRPWPCIAPVATRQGFDRVLAVAVDRGSSGELVLTGRLATSSGNAPAANQRFCHSCSDEEMATRAAGLAQQLIAASSVATGSTTIEIRTIPAGAVITLDNKMIGGVDRILSTSPGPHTIALQLSGYEPEVRQVLVREGEAVKLEVRFRPLRASGSMGRRSEPGQDRFPRWLPVAMVGAGSLAVVAGSWISLAADPDVGEQQSRYDYSVSGLVVASIGAVIVGGGVALWRWPPTRSRASAVPTVTLLTGGAVAGMTASF